MLTTITDEATHRRTPGLQELASKSILNLPSPQVIQRLSPRYSNQCRPWQRTLQLPVDRIVFLPAAAGQHRDVEGSPKEAIALDLYQFQEDVLVHEWSSESLKTALRTTLMISGKRLLPSRFCCSRGGVYQQGLAVLDVVWI